MSRARPEGSKTMTPVARPLRLELLSASHCWAVICHLERGSTRVKAGENTAEGWFDISVAAMIAVSITSLVNVEKRSSVVSVKGK